MPQVRKFGAFGGVFTPSILTILGVIMYLRLPSIVGQAGLVTTLLIIVVAHIISVATGLSVSSIATDKKVRAGGTYYIISRSLGLPIGGTLGLALFVGLSFSVSLYLIGFSESFLTYWGLPADRNTIRLAGSIALVVVSTVTLISTALALKTQFYIMAAIALSLLSILLGRHELAPAAGALAPVATAAPFIVLFGIFFPAVTGFEAGVSMSGDLTDPKRAIPRGTLSAIAVGLLVYIGLTIFLARTVSADQLANNPRVLLDIALFPPLVVAGIWGATISSAFGSILSAPRILQATSTDGITPRWFARGYGRENEPRHALVLAFLIAEAGILIGELNAIARIVSMFFITTYGFLNLTAAIESRVSPDFRPSFRVPPWVGLVGGTACFVVMIELDFPAMVGATVLLGGLYLHLKRKQLRLEMGDTWEGVWSALARAALSRLVRADTHRRNWRPNILLFAGESAARSHLVDFALQLTSQRGVLTNVEVVRSGERLPAARDGSVNVFSRRVQGADVYQTIEQVARHYGFAGIEPNTVLLGWARSQDAARFTSLLQSLVELDLNVLLLDYDRARGWGRRERIDVWWRLTGNDVAFSLALVRFLTTSDDWRGARVRFLTVNDGDSALTLSVSSDLARVLSEHRVEAEVQVINNALSRRSFIDIVRSESIEADLTVLGLADIRGEDGASFITDTNALVDVLGTALVTHASSLFREPLVESAALAALRPELAALPAVVADQGESPPPLELPAAESLAALVSGLDAGVQDLAAALSDDYLGPAYELNRRAITEAGEWALEALRTVQDGAGSVGARFQDEALARIQSLRDVASRQRALLAAAIEWLPGSAAERADSLPARVEVTPPAEAWNWSPRRSLRTGIKRWALLTLATVRRRPASYWCPLRALARARLGAFGTVVLDEAAIELSADFERTATAVRRLAGSALEYLDAAGRAGGEAQSTLADGVAALKREAAAAARANAAARARSRSAVRRAARETANELGRYAAWFDTAAALREASRETGPARAPQADVAAAWAEVQELVSADAEFTLRLNGLADRAALVADVARARTATVLQHHLVIPLESLRRSLEQAAARPTREQTRGLDLLSHLDAQFHPEAIVEQVRASFEAEAAAVPVSVSIPAEDSLAAVAAGRFDEVVAATLPARQVVDYVAEAELLGPLLEDLALAAPKVAEAAEVGREVAQLTAFHLGTLDAAGADAASEEQVAALLRAGVARIGRAVDLLQEVQAELEAAIDRHSTALAGRLDGTTIHRLAERLPQYLRSRRGRYVLSGLQRATLTTRNWLSGQAVGVVYRRSEGVVLARQLRREASGGPDSGEPLRRLVESVSPRPDVYDRLPHYYRQLFLGRPAVTGQLAIGFQHELAEAEAALSARGRGAAGALVVLGEPGQGRRTLSNIIAGRYAGPARVIGLDAPEGGSIDPTAFTARLARALGVAQASPVRLAGLLPPGSALVIHNLERWWERSPEGSAVIDVLEEVLARAPGDSLFIINAGPQPFRLLNRLRPLDDRILRVIECEPFNARQLQQVMLPRHAATGLTFELAGRREDQLSEFRLARLFDAHFAFSAGNLGVALHAWIANIEQVEGDQLLRIRAPRRPPLDPFDALGHVDLMLLVQHLLHGQLTRERLARVTGLDPGTLASELRALLRAGVLRESAIGALAVDRFIRPHLSRFLSERELL